MGMFAALDMAMSGATVSRVWMDAIADNVANVNTVRPAGEEPFRARLVVAQEVLASGGIHGDVRGGVRVQGITESQADPTVSYEPGNPLADERGIVTRPVVDLSQEMTNLIIASRSYEANLSVVDRVRDSYMAALRIGQR